MRGNNKEGLLEKLGPEERIKASDLFGIKRLKEDLGFPIDQLQKTGWSAKVVAGTTEGPTTVRFSRGETTISAGRDVLKIERLITPEVKLSVLDDKGPKYTVSVAERPLYPRPGRTVIAVFGDSGPIIRDECCVLHDIRGKTPLSEAEDVALLRTSLERLDLGETTETTENGIGFKGLSREGVENNATKGPKVTSLLKRLISGESR